MFRFTLSLNLTAAANTLDFLGIIIINNIDTAHVIISRTRAAVERPGVVGMTLVTSIPVIGGAAVKTRTVFFQEQADEISYW